MEYPKFTFRQAQSTFDLISILQAYEDSRLVFLGGEGLVWIVHSSACRFTSETEAKCYERLASIALGSAEGADIAVAVLVANDLQQGMWCGDTKELAEAATERVRHAPLRLRTAILRGLDALEDFAFRHEPTEYFLPKECRLTRHMDQILPKLCHLARRTDQPTLKSIAASNYGDKIEKHLEALNNVLSREDCRFSEDEYWYPSEVVELVAHVRRTQGFVQCTALLLANALPTNDAMGWFEFRWERLAIEYNKLPHSVRPPILAGIRYLYESDNEFICRSQRKVWNPVLAPERLIQPVNLPEDCD
jgi:hypothetical protein